MTGTHTVRMARPAARAGAYAAMAGIVLALAATFLPWEQAGVRRSDFWHLGASPGLSGDHGVYLLAAAMTLILSVWALSYFAWRGTVGKAAWASGLFVGAALLYGADLRVYTDLAASAHGLGEVVAAVGITALLAGSTLGLAARIAES
ncbi:hypothetical protein [Salininema proteolyticum]|uniref:DUF998 domain-containing protein n=1 Tax=Salininema proteolyticum TaxID=1607685 RepID=A0ABV8U0P9_9ACTN